MPVKCISFDIGTRRPSLRLSWQEVVVVVHWMSYATSLCVKVQRCTAWAHNPSTAST